MGHDATALELATTLELIEELDRRFDCGLLVIGSRDTPGDESKERFEVWRMASLSAAFGLLHRARKRFDAEDEGADEEDVGLGEQDARDDP